MEGLRGKMDAAKWLAGLNLSLRVKEENHIYVGDFFTEDGTFVDSFAMAKGLLPPEDFEVICEGWAKIVWSWPLRP
jgi:hypothetical protein